MHRISPGERLNGPLDVLESCSAVFEIAYLLHLSDWPGVRHVEVAGDAELIRLSDLSEPYDIVLGRPHLNASVEPGIGFWVARINTRRAQKHYEYPYLVALTSDGSQFYAREREDDQPIPYGVQSSQEIIAYMQKAKFLELTDV